MNVTGLPSDPTSSDPELVDPVFTDPVSSEPKLADPKFREPVESHKGASLTTKIHSFWLFTSGSALSIC